MHRQIIRKLIVWIVVLTFSFAGVTPALSGLRIMPTGSVKVYEKEKLVQVLKQESALPDGALLTTEGKCGVRSEDFYLVADDGCTFSIMDGLNRKDLRVDNGLVYFAITRKTGKLAFITPAGVISTQQVLSSASANGGIVKGYLDVNGSQVQLGVLEGGSMVVNTDNGDKEILAGKQITLSMADPISKEGEEDHADKKEEDLTGEGEGVVAAEGEGGPFAEGEEGASAEGEKGASAEGEKGISAEGEEGPFVEGVEVLSDEGEEERSAEKGFFGDIPTTYLIGGSVLVGAAVLGIASAGGGGDGGPGPASPAAP